MNQENRSLSEESNKHAKQPKANFAFHKLFFIFILPIIASFIIYKLGLVKDSSLANKTTIATNFVTPKLDSLPEKKYKSLEGIDVRFDLNKKDISAVTKEVILVCQKVYDDIIKLPDCEKRFETVLKPLADLENFIFTYSNTLTFPHYVSTNSVLRDAASKSELELANFHIEVSMNEELFESVKKAIANSDLTKLTEEERRYSEKLILDFKRNGLSIPKEKRGELKELLNKIQELQIRYSSEISKDSTFVEVEMHELEGLGANFLDSLESYDKDGKKVYKLTMQYPHYVPAMENCSVESTRKKLELAYFSRCLTNIPVLEEVVKLRLKVAKLLGYESHSHYVLEQKMAKDPKSVFEFLNDMKSKLVELGAKEIQTLLKVKQQLEPNATQVNSWDLSYLKSQLLKTEYQLDHQKIQEYFPFEHVTDVMFSVFQNLLGLKFSLVQDPKPYCTAEGSNIKLYKVEERDSSDLVGYFYLDLFPRADKYSHAACFPLQQGCELPDKPRQVPVAALVTNFSPPTDNLPSLLSHKEVITYFHEFGHVMHHICSETQLARFAGLTVEGDFVETPSQILENWGWDKQILQSLSKHYRTGEKIETSLIDTLVKSRFVGNATLYLRQLSLGFIDMQLHSITDESTQLDISKQFEELKAELLNIHTQPNLHPMATFGHLTSGYDAGYYGYLWAEVIATDMFKEKFYGTSLNSPSQLGLSYRRNVLSVGSSKDAKDIVFSFLGRNPNSENFFKST